MTFFYRTLCLAGVISFLLTACDSIPFVDTSSDYKGAGRGRPLEVPPDLTSISTDETYSVPGGTTYSNYSQGQATQEPQEKLLPSAEGVRLERAGTQRWLVVSAPPEKVWAVVREFWTDLGFAVRIENMQTGVMETEWVDPTSITQDEKGNYLDKFQGWLDKLNALNTRQKFRTRIDRGSEDDVTEIYLSHRSVSEVPDDGKTKIYTPVGKVDAAQTSYAENFKVDDKARAAAEDLDAELLRRLMVKLGISEQQSRTILANPVQQKRATLEKAQDGSASLVLNDPFDRAWRRVGLALDRVGFLVEDRDRSRGIFYVKYSDLAAEEPEQDQKGLLDSLKFWGDDDDKEKAKPAPAAPARKEDKGMVDKLKFWESDKEKAAVEAQYRIRLDRGGDTTTVKVVDKDGKQDRSSTANRILNMLFEQLK